MDDLDHKLEIAIKNTQDLYLSDELPWVVGYSGGKDSTATLQIIWTALAALPKGTAQKPVHVISTDTLVENPIVAIWVKNSLDAMRSQARGQALPITPYHLKPDLKDRFWVNLIGRGYPAPRPMFRWCTSRLKISASTKHITQVADQYGEAILVLGSRRAESNARDRVMAKYEKSTRELLSRNSDSKLDRVWVYTPVSNWTNDDVWEYLVTHENPWGYDNNALFQMYKGATPDAECPLVVDKSTPSCGDSRFGCFVCTMVTEDKSMQAMIQNDDEKRWMAPLLDFRNEYLKTEGDRNHREFTRMDGSLTVQFLDDKKGKVLPTPAKEVRIDQGKKHAALVHGPYTQLRREQILEALLITQVKVNAEAPKSIGKFELISIEELEEIRRIWIHDKHEFEDSVPQIYERATGLAYPIAQMDESTPFRPDDIRLLRKLLNSDTQSSNATTDLSSDYLHFRLLRELLHVQHSYRSALRRVGLGHKLEKALETGSFQSEEEALEFAIESRKPEAETRLSPDDPYVRPINFIGYETDLIESEE
jgi:DNA sulfur modification protein DndC